MHVILVGADAALLEGLAQSFASQGFTPRVVATLFEACEEAAESAPIMAVLPTDLAFGAPGDALAIMLAPGGSLVVYRGSEAVEAVMPASLRRAVLAELTLPLERHRLMALAQHVEDRARTTGRVRGADTSLAVTKPPG